MKARSIVSLLAAMAMLAVLALGLGCAPPPDKTLNRDLAWTPNKIAVLPYHKVLPDKETGPTVSCPLTGSMFTCGQIVLTAENTLNEQLNEQLKKVSKVPFVPYPQAGLVYSLVAGRSLTDTARQEIVATGKELKVDLVLVGFVYRYRQRVGDAYGAEKPASVAFDLSAVRVRDGSVIWKNSFDQTQKSLSSDLLNLGQYMKHGLRWLTAEQLSGIGMAQIMEGFPWRKAPAKSE
ncbi:MAG: hypothetical protein K9K66_13240 [Desulfarculaceae bacterium]|nr:hypothetical protein [Desulfarculaceae bacterium]MCF8073930.1 hypothetical protein [Desulfarculaceae bacterium]MCF8102616.1 hypothetical protein [Desulfarculaceae bacterium]MCF8117615.1 hypothetical protein [Desulfarculaceae bacterium]